MDEKDEVLPKPNGGDGVPEPRAETPPAPLEPEREASGAAVRAEAGEAAEPAQTEPGAAEDERIKLALQAAELKERLLRALAEMENLRKRSAREVEDAGKYAIAAFARDLLNVSDNLRRALDNIPEDAKAEGGLLKTIAEGIEMTERELLALFERHGIRKIEPLGEPFDYDLHQVMFEVPGSGKLPGTVVKVVQPGYVIGERLLRPAMVAVAKDADGANDANGPGRRVDTTA